MAKRMIGLWSYDVPQFEVTRLPQPKHFTLNRDDYAGQFDVLFWEDARTVGTITGNAVPLAYYVGDSTLSPEHFSHRYLQSRQADLILVDWDKLSRFDDTAIPVKRLSYCVNDQLFYPREKTVDVGFYASITDERRDLYEWLKAFCATRGYSFDGGRREDSAYCNAIGSARINVNLNRNPYTRAHRCYDVMASESCLLTSPMPQVSGEAWAAGYQYRNWRNEDHLEILIDAMLSNSLWMEQAQRAYAYVQEHTWLARAAQLHAMLTEFLQERERHVTVH